MHTTPDIVPVCAGQGPQAGAWPLHNSMGTRQAEATALAQTSPGMLMQRAGLAVARLSRAVAPHAQRVVVFCGPGNNGGDGLVAATLLFVAGQSVQVYLLGDADKLPSDAKAAWQRACAAGVAIAPMPRAETCAGGLQADLVIDALLGIGSRRAPEGELARAIETIAHMAAPVLSVDLPSGLHPDSGALLGARAVRASHTLALLTLKTGCFTAQGRDHAGALWLAGLGVDSGPAQAWASAAPALSSRRHSGHKGSFGDVLVVGGAPGMVGAAWLAARAALAAGAGRIWVSLLDPAANTFDAARPELMQRCNAWLSAPTTLAACTVVCGCGGGDAVRATLPPLLAHAGRLVLDADALNAVATDPALRRLLRARAGRGLASVLTPHPLEAARLLASDSRQVQHDRLAAAQALADEFGCAVLLKGSGSVIAAPSALPQINPTGNAALASAGTGDVLAGWLGGQWAQQPQAAAQGVAAAAAWWHGHAADRHVLAGHSGNSGPLRAADLIEAMAHQPGA